MTFVFTDIEGSTRLLERLGDDAFRVALAQHHGVIRDSIARHHGVEVHTVGDSFFMVFPRADDAVAAVIDVNIALAQLGPPAGANLRVRAGLHTGTGHLGGDDYVGIAVHQASRVCSAAHGGQVVVTETARDAVRTMPEGASWRALGRHRLKDLGSPLGLYQLCHPLLPLEHPALRSLESVGHNLPIQPSSFLGRSRELEKGWSLLCETRLLSVVGPVGTGKTRLAYQLAAEHADQFAGGVWVAELASVSDPGLVPAALVDAMAVRDEAGVADTASILTGLRSGPALVVLDNCEHVAVAASALASELVQGNPTVRVLVTSREALRATGETVFPLGPLALPVDDDAPLAELAATDAVSLFCERAAEARTGFALSAANAGAVTRICARLQGNPLAIELAAARVRTLPLNQIVDRLEHSLDLLSKGSRGATERHASLRGAIEWSHNLLTAAEQTLFRRLAVFPGPFTGGAAETVCAGGELGPAQVTDLLQRLVDKSLANPCEEADGEVRYVLLETIRAYASERLELAGETAAMAQAHGAYCAEVGA